MIAKSLEKKGISGYVINVGGNVRTVGEKGNGEKWLIGIENPDDSTDEQYIEYLEFAGESVVTSGSYQRFYFVNGKSYHHILNPQTGMPCDNGVVSVTIISKESFTGDCLSTGCFVMGLEDGMKLVDSMDGVYAVYIDSENNVHFSEGAEEFVREKRSK